MEIKTVAVCILFMTSVFGATQIANGVILENAFYRAEITAEGTGSHPPGSLLEFSRFQPPICDALDGMSCAGKVTAGAYTPAPGLIQFLSDTEAVFASAGMVNSQGGQLPVRVTIFYKLMDDGLHLDWIVDCPQEVTFTDGLHFEWDLSPWNDLYGYNQVGAVDSFSVEAITGTSTRSLRSAWRLRRGGISLWILQPDPLQARWRIRSGSLDQEWLHARNPRTTLTPISQFPKIASTLCPGRSIWGSLTLKIGSAEASSPDPETGRIFLSGMPNQADQGWIHMWDELPLVPETFVPMTTTNNPASPVGSKIVALLVNHPRMKNVLLMALDKQLSGYPFKPNLPGWSVPESFVCIDTVEQVEGSGALTVSHYTARDTWLTQNISCTPYTLMRLSGWFRVDSLSSGSAGVEIAAAPYGNPLEHLTFENPMNWSFRQVYFDTGPYTSLTVKVGMTGGPGKSRFDALALERESAPGNLLANGGFNAFSFNVHYDGEGLEWWHAHGNRRFAANAPQSYLDFLHLIESGGISYGWEDRVCLGMHCYHHTASELYPLGPPYSNEFDFYDPAGDSGRFAMIHRDLVSSGLTDASFRVLRFAAHKHQMPAVRECIKAGVKLIDCGETLWQFLLGPIFQPEGVIWETNTNWWCDSSYWQDPAMVEYILRRGELVLSGGHPLAAFPLNNQAQFEIVSGVFQQMETAFPFMQYFFPEEYADFCEESRLWWDVEAHSTPSSLTFTFYGSARHGQTIVALLPDSSLVIGPAYVDAQPTEYTVRGNRICIPLPDLPEGYHTIHLMTGVGIQPSGNRVHLPERVAIGLPFPNPCNAWLIIPVDLPKPSEVHYQLFDALGRMAARGTQSFPEGRHRLSLEVETLPSGAYFYQVQAEDLQSAGSVTILK